MITPVKNQGRCCSCLAVGNGWTQTMSEQQILDCNTWGSGCQGGGSQRQLSLQCSSHMTPVKDGGAMLSRRSLWVDVPSRDRPTLTVSVEEVCEIHKPNRHNNHRTSKHASTSWRSDGPPSCLGGSSHGWVPVKTHSAPVPTSVERLWLAHLHSNTQQ